MNLASILILLLVLAGLWAAIRSLRRTRKEPDCSCSCSGCSLREYCDKR